jgi:hypothetical protein
MSAEGAEEYIWPSRDQVTREWRKPQHVELYDLYSSPNNVWVIKSRRRAGNVPHMGRGFYKVWWGCVGNSVCERPRHIWRDDIKKDLKKGECGGMDWINVAQDGDMWQALINADELLGTIKLGKFVDYPRTGWLLKKDSFPWRE